MAREDKKPGGTAAPVLKRVCALAAVLVAGLAAGSGIVLYLYLASGQTRLLDLINTQIPGTLSWDRLELSPIRGRLAVRDLVLKDPAGTPVARIAALEAEMDWAGIRAGELRFSSVKITDPHLSLDLPSDGRDSLTASLVQDSGGGSAAGTPGLPFGLSIGEALIRGGKLDLTLPGKTLALDKVDLTFSGSLDQDSLTGLNLTAKAPGISFTATGSVSRLFQNPVPDVTSKLTLDTRTAARILIPENTQNNKPGNPIDGTATLGLRLKGTLDDPTAEVSLAFGPGSLLGQPVTFANLTARLENRCITLNPSAIDPGPGPFELEGSLDLSPMFPDGFTGKPAGPETLGYTLTIRHKSLPVKWLVSRLSGSPEQLNTLNGTLSPVLTVTGQGMVPGSLKADIQADIDARGITTPEITRPADLRITASARLEDTALNLSTISLTGLGFSGQGDGRIGLPGLDPEKSLSARVTLSAPDLSIPANHLGMNAAGTAILSLAAAGSLDKPVLTADLDAKNLSAFGVRAEGLTAAAQIDRDNLVIREALLTREAGTGEAPGRLRAEGRIGLKADPDLALDLSLEDMDIAGLVPEREIRGRVFGHISAGGTLNHPRIQARMTGKALEINEIQLGRIDTDLSLSESTLSIVRAELFRGSTRVTAEGRINLEDRTIDLRAVTPELDLSELPGLDGQVSGRAAIDLGVKGPLSAPELAGRIQAADLKTEVIPDIRGALSAEFRARGPLDNPEAIKARAGLSRFSLTRDGRPLIEMETADLFLEGLRLRLAPVPVRLLGQGRLTLEGRLDPDGSLAASARGSIPLALAPDLAEGIQSASGDIRLSLSAAGPVRSPDIRGDLSFSDLNLALEDLTSPLRNIRGTVRLTPEEIRIEQLEGNLGEGQFKLKGTAGLAQGKPDRFALNLEAFQLPIDIPDTLTLSLNSRLSLDGTLSASRLTGTIDILEGRYYKDVDLNLKDLAPRKTRQMAPAKPATGPDLLKAMALNIHVRRREPLLVDNNLAALTVSPDLTVRGTALSPILAGRAQVDEGTIFFQKAKFDVTGGTVDFVNPYKLEPEINVTGETTIRSWTITVRVAGTPDDLRLTFSSDPSEPDADILSLITLGKTTREMASAKGGAQIAGAGAAAGLIAGPLGEKLKEATGLDEVDIRMDDSGETTGVKISLGADLSRQLSVAYGMDIKDGETVQQVTTYYKLLENLLMNGFQDTSGRFGGGLKYRLEFR